MIRGEGVIYKVDTPTPRPSTKKEVSKGLDGDSGVGQAPEFPSKPLAKPSLHQVSHAPLPKLLSHIGTGLILFSLLGFTLTYGPILKVEFGYRLSRWFPISESTPKGSFAQVLEEKLLGEMEGVPDPNFSLIIPKIHAKGKIIPNVDPGNEKDYLEALKSGVAHAKGTRFPGQKGNIFLFAHSTDSPLNIARYNAIFYLLRELKPGDKVEVYFFNTINRYQVREVKIVEPTDVSYLSAENRENKEQLILQTCWPPGTTLKRLLVFAEKLK